MREWRKVGEGTLVLAGSRQNEIFLNLWGTGTTRLEQKDGYAACSVLANTGSKVVLEDVGRLLRTSPPAMAAACSISMG